MLLIDRVRDIVPVPQLDSGCLCLFNVALLERLGQLADRAVDPHWRSECERGHQQRKKEERTLIGVADLLEIVGGFGIGDRLLDLEDLHQQIGILHARIFANVDALLLQLKERGAESEKQRRRRQGGLRTRYRERFRGSLRVWYALLIREED